MTADAVLGHYDMLKVNKICQSFHMIHVPSPDTFSYAAYFTMIRPADGSVSVDSCCRRR